jgi:regulator of replication initiation timing
MSELEKWKRMVSIYQQQVSQLNHEIVALQVETESLREELRDAMKPKKEEKEISPTK